MEQKANLSLELILNGDSPQLIDEWNIVPKVWDGVRRKCDETNGKGKYILTCSTKLNDEENKKINHSGAGRIAKIKMGTMSLYESKDSTGKVSIMDMYNNNIQNSLNDKISLEDIANLIIRGGWPSNINISKDKSHIIPKSYI